MRVPGRGARGAGGRAEPVVYPTPPTSVPKTETRVTCVWGARHSLPHGGLYILCQPGSEPRVALFLRFLGGTVTPPRPPASQVHLGPSRREESGNARPWQPFRETFASHAGPRSAGESFAVSRLRAPRTWPESADLGTLRGETPGAFRVPACGEKKHLCLSQGESLSRLASSR